MAGTLLTVYTDQLQRQRRGMIAMSLTDFSAITVSEIAAGSVIEIAGAEILFEADESMGSNWAAMAAGIVYAYINGVTLVSTYTQTAPTWNDELQGWYDATGAHRYYARLYKTAGSEYTQKARFTSEKQILIMADGIGLNPIADADVRIRVASGGDVLWDNSDTRFVLTNDHKPRLSYHSNTNMTQNEVFDLLSPFVPNTGDEIYAVGIINDPPSGSTPFLINRLRRSAATAVIIFGMRMDTFQITSESFVDGVGTTGWNEATFTI